MNDDPLHWVLAAMEVSVVFPLLVGKESMRATMPPGRDRRVVLAGYLVAIALCALLILFMPSDM